MNLGFQEWEAKVLRPESLYVYEGPVNSDIITTILDTIEKKMDEVEPNSKVSKKVYNVLVEALQNLFHHAVSTPKELIGDFGENFIILQISQSGASTYNVIAGNFVTKEKAQILKDRIEQINYLSQDELKSLYKLILNNEEFSEKGGGGLGLIDIAKKTGRKLSYYFHQFDGENLFYAFEVNI